MIAVNMTAYPSVRKPALEAPEPVELEFARDRSEGMVLEIDDDVKAVAEVMVQNVAAAKLVAVARALDELAPLFWGAAHYAPENISTLRLEHAHMGSCVPQTLSRRV